MDSKYFEQVVLVLYMIILGLGMVHHVSNVGHCLRRHADVTTYWIHTLWVLLIFVLQTQMAEHIYGFRCQENWNNGYVLLVLLNPLIGYIAVALCFPSLDKVGESIDLRKHYFEIQRPFFVSLAVLAISNYITTSIILASWSFGMYQAMLLVFFVLVLLLAFVSHQRTQAITTTAVFLAFSVFSVLFSSNFAKDAPEGCALRRANLISQSLSPT